jgi:hypothetical protein
MSTTYDITIINENGKTNSYMLFAEPPNIDSSGKPNVFTNVWMTTPPIVSNKSGSSSADFSISTQYYAICGTSAQMGQGVKIKTTNFEKVTLGSTSGGVKSPGTTLSFTAPGAAVNFPVPSPPASAPVGAYSIVTDDSFATDDPGTRIQLLSYPSNVQEYWPSRFLLAHIFIGLGGKDMTGKVVPVSTIPAVSSSTFTIFPLVKFYISTGSFSEGEIINVRQVGKTQLVDFTELQTSEITLVHNSDGSYTMQTAAAARKHKLHKLAVQKFADEGVLPGDK